MHLENVFTPLVPIYESVVGALKTAIVALAAWVHGLSLPEAIFYGLLAIALSYPATTFLRYLSRVGNGATEDIMKSLGGVVKFAYAWLKKKAELSKKPLRFMWVFYAVGIFYLVVSMRCDTTKLSEVLRAAVVFYGIAIPALVAGEVFRREAKRRRRVTNLAQAIQ